MVPFRVYDRDKREMWIVLNFHPGTDGGNYLIAREDESEADGEMRILPSNEMARLRLVDFLDEADDFAD